MKEGREQRFEDAPRERNRLGALISARAPRVAHQTVGTLDAIAVAVAEGEAAASYSSTRRRALRPPELYLETRRGHHAAPAEAFILQY